MSVISSLIVAQKLPPQRDSIDGARALSHGKADKRDVVGHDSCSTHHKDALPLVSPAPLPLLQTLLLISPGRPPRSDTCSGMSPN